MIKQIFKLIWRQKSNNALLLLEILLSFLVLFGVISFVKYNTDKLKAPLGFETENRWKVQLSEFIGKDSTEIAQTLISLKQNLLDMDKIEQVAYSDNISIFSGSMSLSTVDKNGFAMTSSYSYGDQDMAKTLGINVVEGRWFTKDDAYAKYEPMIVTQRFMDEYYPHKSMVDSIISFNGDKKIVGVIEGFKYQGYFEDEYNNSLFFMPETSEETRTVYLKMAQDVNVQYEEQVKNRIASVLKTNDFLIVNLAVESRMIHMDIWIIIAVLICISLFLCVNVALGLFGVLWYNINKRRSEIGLRRALGAHSTSITKQFILETFVLSGIAILIGIFFAIQIPLLHVTEIPDSNYYYAILYATLIIIGLVLACAYYPSLQAAKISPAVVLHEE